MAAEFSYRFVYFDVRGAGELCRLVLVAGGFDWADLRYPMGMSKVGFAPGHEFSRDAGQYACNMNRLPVLQVIDTRKGAAVATLGQSHAIARFLSRQHPSMMGKNEIEAAKIDSIYECCRDIQSSWYKAKKNGQKKAWIAKELPQLCLTLEQAILSIQDKTTTEQESKWIMGGSDLSLADIAIYHLLSSSVSVVTGGVVSFMDNEEVCVAYEGCPKLKASIQATGGLDSIQQWVEERPDTFA